MDKCEILPQFGYTITYNRKKDERKSGFTKEQNQQQRNAQKEKEDAEKAEAAKQKKTAAAKKKADKAKKKAAAAKKKKEEEEAFQSPTENDSDSQTTAGTACRGHLHANCFGALATDTDSDSESQLLVDSSTACNNVNNPNSTEYFDVYVYNDLRKFDCNGKRCISIAHHHCRASHLHVGSNCSSCCVRKQIVPDSEVTAHMRICKDYFEPNSYIACSDIFVLMGDGSKVPVAGYGVSHIKINGQVLRLKIICTCLHQIPIFFLPQGTNAITRGARFYLVTQKCT